MHRLRWLLFGLLALGLYLWTMGPSVMGGDSGELLLASWTGGVAHPPGYPLYTMLTWAFAKALAFGDVAWRYNVFSGVCNAIAAVVLGRLVERITKDFWAGLVTASILAFSPLMWRYSVVAEVFGLNQVLIAAFLSVLWSFLEVRSTKNWLLLCLISGLGVAHHHTSVMVTVPVMTGLLWQDRRIVLRRLPGVLVSMAAGLLPYLYIIAAAQSVPLMAWGNTSTLSGAIVHFLRQEYGTLKLGNAMTGTEHAVLLRLGYFAMDLPLNSLFGLGVWWTVAFFRRTFGASARSEDRPQLWSYAAWTAMACTVYLLSFTYLANLSLELPLGYTIQSRFWLQALLFFGVWAGLGFGLAQGWWSQHRRAIACGGLVVLIPFGLATESQRHVTEMRDYGIRVLESLPKDAILFYEGDHTFGAIGYAQRVLGIRPDVDAMHINFLSHPWSRRWAAANYPRIVLPNKGTGQYLQTGYNFRELYEANHRDGREIFSINAVIRWDKSMDGFAELMPWGMTRWIVPVTEPKAEAFAKWRKASIEFFQAFTPHWDPSWPVGAMPRQNWEQRVATGWLEARHDFAGAMASLYQELSNGNATQAQLEEVRSHFEVIAPVWGKTDERFWKNYGLVNKQLADKDPKYAQAALDAWRRYLVELKGEDKELEKLRLSMIDLERMIERQKQLAK